MHNYVISLKCTECNVEFQGHTQDHPLGNWAYLCACPGCDMELTLPVKPGYSQSPTPKGSVKVSMVKSPN